MLLSRAAAAQEVPPRLPAAPAPAPPAQQDTGPDFGWEDDSALANFPPVLTSEARGAVDWNEIRSQWTLDPREVNLSAMLFASHPASVRQAIERHAQALDASPVTYLEENNRPLQNAARAQAGRYFGTLGTSVGLCESTTSGIGLLYNGLILRPGQEVLTTTHDYYVTHESLRMAAARTGATARKITLFAQSEAAQSDQIVELIIDNIRPETRVLALTWVHSSTGLKMPIAAIAAALAPINAARPLRDRVLFCVDGAHGFGVENVTLPALGCDFLVSSCHKWLFGPRGTAVVFGTHYGWSRVSPTVPTFLEPGAYSSWIGGYEPGPNTAARMTPGGFKAFEHIWAMSEAFKFHHSIGKAAIAARTAELAGRMKAGLSAIGHVSLRTPLDPAMSAGIVSFDIAGLTADQTVNALRRARIVASAAPYAVRHARLTPSFRNTQEEVDYALNVIDGMRIPRRYRRG